MKGKNLAIATVGLMVLTAVAVFALQPDDSKIDLTSANTIEITVNEDGTISSNRPDLIATVNERASTDELVRAYEAGEEDKLAEYYLQYGGDGRWKGIANFKKAIYEYINYEEISRARKVREDALGTWQQALETGVVVKEFTDDGDLTKHYDVTGDGIGDFEFIFEAGKATLWRYMDVTGKPYG